jgi:hypothetical protein
MTLTPTGAALVASFNERFVYARCNSCGVFGCPPRDGYLYACPRETCLSGKLVAIDPATLAYQSSTALHAATER